MFVGYVLVIVDQIGFFNDLFEILLWIQEKLQENICVWLVFEVFFYFYKCLKVGWIVEVGNWCEVVE